MACVISSSAWAEKGYAVNNHRIIMRRGPKTSFKIVQMLRIGEELEILESDARSGWDRVRVIRSGREGWVLHRSVSASQPPKMQLKINKEALRQATEERDRLRIETANLRKQIRSQKKLEAELSRIRMLSHNTLEIEQKNEMLSQKVRRMEKDMARLADDKRILERQADNSLFLAGAAVLIVGFAGGAILARRRPASYGSL